MTTTWSVVLVSIALVGASLLWWRYTPGFTASLMEGVAVPRRLRPVVGSGPAMSRYFGTGFLALLGGALIAEGLV